ncbi:unnamed protein product [Prorocentrum cordatum]|uniref:Uncharacterized protein n=1 Tax=Prorocentrum cordatum TaxID=2364126 RepID=A0ABN9WLR0_9DINO|nr:unnamed protein product [Polarella glacialis]
MFRSALQDLQLDQRILPCPARRSGPSIGVTRHYRTLEDIQKRGQWKHAKSMQRCEKAARLGQSRAFLQPHLRERGQAANVVYRTCCSEMARGILSCGMGKPLPQFRSRSFFGLQLHWACCLGERLQRLRV